LIFCKTFAESGFRHFVRPAPWFARRKTGTRRDQPGSGRLPWRFLAVSSPSGCTVMSPS
jgi:hypothetical protein